MRIGCFLLAFILLVLSFPCVSLADAVLPTKIGKVTDFDKLHQAFDYPSGAMVASGGDFWIADSSTNRPQAIVHVWESPGIQDMGVVDFNSISEAQLTGYQGEVSPVEGHVYVTISRGCYGKFRIDDILKPGDRPGLTVTEFSITYAYQPNGSRSLATGTSTSSAASTPGAAPSTSASTPSTTTVTPTPPALTGNGVYESYQGSPDIGGDVRMNYWHAQTFTAQSSHPVSAVRLMAYRIASPGTLIVSLRATDAGGHPAGADLVSGTTSGNTLTLASSGEWREIVFPSPYNLIGGTKYAIVVRAPGGGGGNVVKWLHDSTSPSYYEGSRESSGDSGITWQTDLGSDYLFEVLGASSGSAQSQAAPPPTSSTPSSKPLTKPLGNLCPLSAAYGSPEAPELYVFRQFRDRVLAKDPAGRALIGLYYTAGSTVVDVMGRYELLKWAVKYGMAQPAALMLNSTAAIW